MFIYKITNKINGLSYIGQTKSFIKRIKSHINCLNNNKHRNRIFQNSFNKYGIDAFEIQILEKNITCPLVLDYKEKLYIKKFKTMDRKYGFNLESGGNLNKTISEDLRNRLSESHKGYKFSKERKLRISLIMKKIGITPQMTKASILVRSRKVIARNEKLGIEIGFYKITDAEKFTKVKNSNITKCCKGYRKQDSGWTFIYAERSNV